MEFMYLAFIRMPRESYRRLLRFFLLCLCVGSVIKRTAGKQKILTL